MWQATTRLIDYTTWILCLVICLKRQWNSSIVWQLSQWDNTRCHRRSFKQQLNTGRGVSGSHSRPVWVILIVLHFQHTGEENKPPSVGRLHGSGRGVASYLLSTRHGRNPVLWLHLTTKAAGGMIKHDIASKNNEFELSLLAKGKCSCYISDGVSSTVRCIVWYL